MGTDADGGNLVAPLTASGVVNETISPLDTFDIILCPLDASNN